MLVCRYLPAGPKYEYQPDLTNAVLVPEPPIRLKGERAWGQEWPNVQNYSFY